MPASSAAGTSTASRAFAPPSGPLRAEDSRQYKRFHSAMPSVKANSPPARTASSSRLAANSQTAANTASASMTQKLQSSSSWLR